MIQKKICMLGAFAAGKTSLVRRYVTSLFDEKYLTTVGVKIDKKLIDMEGVEVMLMLWDLEGEDDFHSVKTTYLRGSSGYFLVADGTRKETLALAQEIKRRTENVLGELPHLLLVNKSDLANIWEIDQEEIDTAQEAGHPVRLTSAKNGTGVEEAFRELVQMMLEQMVEEEV